MIDMVDPPTSSVPTGTLLTKLNIGKEILWSVQKLDPDIHHISEQQFWDIARRIEWRLGRFRSVKSHVPVMCQQTEMFVNSVSLTKKKSISIIVHHLGIYELGIRFLVLGAHAI